MINSGLGGRLFVRVVVIINMQNKQKYLGLYVYADVRVTARPWVSPATRARIVDAAAVAAADPHTTTTPAASRTEAAELHHLQAPCCRTLPTAASAAQDDVVINLAKGKCQVARQVAS